MQRLPPLRSYQERVNRIGESRHTDQARDFDAFFNDEYTPLLRLLFAMTGNRAEAKTSPRKRRLVPLSDGVESAGWLLPPETSIGSL
jgi:hypothetical protein